MLFALCVEPEECALLPPYKEPGASTRKLQGLAYPKEVHSSTATSGRKAVLSLLNKPTAPNGAHYFMGRGGHLTALRTQSTLHTE